MTLTGFKKNIRLFSLLAFLSFYGFAFFLVGRYSKFDFKFSKGSPENKSANSLNTPVWSTIEDEQSQNAQVISAYVKLCANTVYSFQVAYPKDWFTTYNDEDEKCRFFAPYTFIVPKVKDETFVPISIEVSSPDKWQETIKFYENPNDFQNVISSENKDIAGHSGKKILAIATGEGLVPKNFKKVSYLIFDSTYPLVITYNQTSANEETKKMEETLSEMISSLKYY